MLAFIIVLLMKNFDNKQKACELRILTNIRHCFNFFLHALQNLFVIRNFVSYSVVGEQFCDREAIEQPGKATFLH